MGAIRVRLGNIAAAERVDREAVGVLSRLVLDHPAEEVYRDSLAQAHQDMGTIFRDEERWDEAESELKEAASLWGSLAKDRSDSAKYLSKLAITHSRLGKMYVLMHRWRFEEAADELRLALNSAQRLARENPDVPGYQDSLADILYEFARIQMARGDFAGSEASEQQAVAIRENLARDHPEAARHQRLLGRYLAGLSAFLHSAEEVPGGR